MKQFLWYKVRLIVIKVAIKVILKDDKLVVNVINKTVKYRKNVIIYK